MKKLILVRSVFILFTVGLMTAIFLFSAQTSGTSNTLSRGVLDKILDLFGLQFTADMMESLNLILRKIAHFSLYFLLGISTSGIFLTLPIKYRKVFLFSLLVCILFAFSDEFHQHLSGTRNGNMLDVLLDSFGSVCGSFVMIGISRKWFEKILI